VTSSQKFVAVVSILLGFSASVQSSDLAPHDEALHEALHGKWGNASQCARELITPQGTKHFTPFDIQHDWLGYGGIWCRLLWLTVRKTPKGLYAAASARCGEDTVRDYRINFDLNDEVLMLRWDRGLENGPLKRCSE